MIRIPGWWIRRVEGAGRLFDVIRIDHFRGLESYWAVPYGETTAKNGRWRKGPGMDLVGTLTNWFPNLSFIAEDLGFLTPEVHRLLADSGLPGMKVLEFAFDAREPSNYLPHTYGRHCVCYVGTHDNETVEQWRWQAAHRCIRCGSPLFRPWLPAVHSGVVVQLLGQGRAGLPGEQTPAPVAPACAGGVHPPLRPQAQAVLHLHHKGVRHRGHAPPDHAPVEALRVVEAQVLPGKGHVRPVRLPAPLLHGLVVVGAHIADADVRPVATA